MERQYQRIEIKHLPRKTLPAQVAWLLRQFWNSDLGDIVVGVATVVVFSFVLFLS